MISVMKIQKKDGSPIGGSNSLQSGASWRMGSSQGHSNNSGGPVTPPSLLILLPLPLLPTTVLASAQTPALSCLLLTPDLCLVLFSVSVLIFVPSLQFSHSKSQGEDAINLIITQGSHIKLFIGQWLVYRYPSTQIPDPVSYVACNKTYPPRHSAPDSALQRGEVLSLTAPFLHQRKISPPKMFPEW